MTRAEISREITLTPAASVSFPTYQKYYAVSCSEAAQFVSTIQRTFRNVQQNFTADVTFNNLHGAINYHFRQGAHSLRFRDASPPLGRPEAPRGSSGNSILFLINYKFSPALRNFVSPTPDFLHDVTMSYYRSPTYPRSVNSRLYRFPQTVRLSYDGTADLSPSNIRQAAPRSRARGATFDEG